VIRCPECATLRVVVVLSKLSQGRCVRCGAKWLQDGGHQRRIRRSSLSRPGSSVGGPDFSA
jgi:Zn-finger nucleic acid-binding protein